MPKETKMTRYTKDDYFAVASALTLYAENDTIPMSDCLVEYGAKESLFGKIFRKAFLLIYSLQDIGYLASQIALERSGL